MFDPRRSQLPRYAGESESSNTAGDAIIPCSILNNSKLALELAMYSTRALYVQIMAQPESVAKGEEWVLAANESFLVDDISQWVQKQTDSEACSLPNLNPMADRYPHGSLHQTLI